jgi:enolase
MSQIKSLKARQILDSRGNPTVEVDLVTTCGHMGRASVPSGASTGTREALELRDGDKNIYGGKSVGIAVKNIMEKIAPLVMGIDVREQQQIDQKMIDSDGSEYKKNLGANSMLAVSLAAARAGSLVEKKPLYRYLRENLKAPTFQPKMTLPLGLMNIINGGAHADNGLDIQEFMVVPHVGSFSENLRAGAEIFHHLKKILHDQGLSTSVGDEGGFAPKLKNHRQALDLLMTSIEKSGRRPGVDVSISLDVAGSEFYNEEKKAYHFEGEWRTSREMIALYKEWAGLYPLYSIEDGLSEKDGASWADLTATLGQKHMIIGDDLFVTNAKIYREGIEKKWANAILVKVNQIGTLSETFETMHLSVQHGHKAIVSHRSGETADSFIADLAVATSCGYIKTGSLCRTDRTEKYNQLLRIEENL